MLRSFILSLTALTAFSGAFQDARAEILATSQRDFSTSTQGTAGWEYGYYLGSDTENGAFSTAGMTTNGIRWSGDQGGNTPAHYARSFQPGANNAGLSGPRSAVVRRYTVGAGGEAAYSGDVRVVGRFFDGHDGDTSVFIAVDADGEGGAAPRTFALPVTPVAGATGAVQFDFVINVTPGTTIDFGALPGSDGTSDSTGLLASIVSGDTSVPTHLVANEYNSVNEVSAGSLDKRGFAQGIVTDGYADGTDDVTFDTTPGTGLPYQHAGLLYLEPAGSGLATRFDSVRIDVAASADFAEAPRLYLLRQNIDPNQANPAADDHYTRLAVRATRATSFAGQPYYTFDLAELSAAERTGYGFAVVGAGKGSSGSIAVSEIAAQAVRVSDMAVTPAAPFWLPYEGHSYAFSLDRGSWAGVEADAMNLGAHLVAINSAAENQFLVKAFGGSEIVYIGLSKPGAAPVTPASYSWTNGEALTYQNWLPSQPDAFQNADDYVQMNYNGAGLWSNVGDLGYPETGKYRGIIESNNPGSGTNNFQIAEISARANIFDAGLANATQGGVLPPSIELGPEAAGATLSFPQIVGVLNTGADVSSPDGGHPSGRSVNLTGVGGISGYLNGNNTPALVGVFLASNAQGQPVQPANQPARLDFSATALGEDFESLAPRLGEVFFIGDGYTSEGRAQYFFVPSGATRLFVGFVDGNNGTLYHGAPGGYGDNTGTTSLRAVLIPSQGPSISTGDFPAAGGQLAAAGGTGALTWSLQGGNFPPHLQLSSAGLISLSGAPRVNGSYTFTVRATDEQGATADKEFTVVVADPVATAPGLVAWWPADQAVGEVVGGLHGRLKDGASFGAGQVGRAFVFNGSTAYVEVADQAALDLTGDLTIEAWINASTTTGNQTLVDKRSADGSTLAYLLQLREGVPFFVAHRTTGELVAVDAGVTVPAGFAHLAVSVSGSTVSFFINGTLVHEATNFPATRQVTDGPLAIGATRNQTFTFTPFNGAIDELTFYNRSLTSTEIQAIHQAGAAGKRRADAARDFSVAANPTGPWSYRELPAAASLSSYNPAQAVLMTGSALGQPAGIDRWSAQATVTHNGSNAFVAVSSGGSQYDWQPGELSWAPGPGSERPVVRWTAPAAGRYAVSATFAGSDTLPGSTDVHIRHGSTALFDGIVSSYRGDGLSTTRTIAVAAGDTVDFILGTNGSWTYDSSVLVASFVFLGAQPEIEQTEFPPDLTSLSVPWRLTATGGTAPYTFSVVEGSLPASIVLEADGEITGELNTPGRTTFTVRVTDQAGQFSEREFTVVVARPVAPASGLAAWFPGELHAHDVAGGAAGVVVGSTLAGPYGAGKVGRGFVFDGIDDSVEVFSTNAVNRVPLTIEAWIKPEVRTDGSSSEFLPPNIVSGDRQNFGGHGIGVNVFPDGSKMWIEAQVEGSTGFREITGVSFTAGQWAHVALVLTPGNAKTYVNGALVDDYSFTQGAMDANNSYRIGRHNEDTGYGTKRFFKGAIDEVSIYSRALSADELLAIVNADSLGKNRADAARDFVAQTNAAGQVWQYGRMTGGTAPNVGSFTRYTTSGTQSSLEYWRDGVASDPNVIRNTGEQPYLHWRAGELSAHPGPAGEFSAIRWTAPEAGAYAVFANFLRLNTQAGSVSTHVRHQSAALHDQTIADLGSRARSFTQITAAAGDTVDFIVGVGDGYGFDATGVAPSIVKLSIGPDLTNTTFPEPAEGSLTIDSSLSAGGQGPFTYAVTGGTLPPGLTLRPDGVVRGTLTENGTFTFTITVTDGAGQSQAKEFSLTVSTVPPPPPFTPAESLTFKANNKAVNIVAGRPTPVIRQDAKFRFDVVQQGDAFAAGLRVRVQYSTTPDNASSWQNLPESSLKRKKDGDTKWYLDTLRMPAGNNLHLRVQTTAENYAPAIGPVPAGGTTVALFGPFNITPTPVIEQTITAFTDSDTTGRTVKPDELIYYTITARNIGSAPATGLVQGLKVPKNTEYANLFNPNSSGGVFASLPKGKSGEDITSVSWNYGTTVIPPNGTVRNTIGVELVNPKGEASHPPFGTIIKANGLSVTYQGKIAEAETEDRVVETTITPPLAVTLETITPVAVRGGAVLMKMTARNNATYDARECQAFYRLPNGARVLFIGKSSGTNFDDFSEAGVADPQESLNPTLTPYIFGKPQVLKWNLGTIAGTDTSPATGPRTRELLFILQVKHDVAPTQIVDGVSVTTALSSVGWNVFYTPPSGGRIPVYARGGPEVRTLISAADQFDPPVLGLEKTAVADTVFQSQIIETDESFAGEVTGVVQGNSISYRLLYKNNGNTAAERCSILERIADGLTFQGFIKVSRTGDPDDEEEIPFNAYRFYDKAGKLISGEPYFDANNNGRYDQGETYTDYTGDKKFTPAGDLRKAEWVRFDLGRIEPGAKGYVSYRSAATAAVGAVIKSDGYSLVSESLSEPITGTPRVTYARVLRGVLMQAKMTQNKTAAAPFDNPSRPQDSEITTEVEIENLGDLPANQTTIALDIPAGLQLVSSALLSNGASTGPEGTLKKQTLTWQASIPVGQKRRVKIVTRVLPTAQLPTTLRRLNSAFLFQEAKITAKFDPRAPLAAASESGSGRFVRGNPLPAKAVTDTISSDSTSVRLVQPSRAEVWAFKSAPLSQESRKNIRYLFAVGNSGTIAAENVEASFYIPPGTSFVGASPSGWTRKGEIIRWKLGSVPAHRAKGLYIDLNIAHLDSGMVKDNSFVVTSDNSPEVVPYVTRTSVRARPFTAGLWEWFSNAVGAIGINLKGPGSNVLQEELNTLSETSRTHATRGATVLWNKNGVGVVPNGGGQVVIIGPTGGVTGGTTIVEGQGTVVVAGSGADIEARGVGRFSGSLIMALVNQARTRSDKNAPSLFVGGNSALVYYSGDQLLDNDTGLVLDAIAPKVGTNLIAAGGGNIIAAGGGNVVAPGGVNLVAAGAGNIVAAGSLNLVAAGAGNVVGTSGGNIVAAGSLNLVAAGAGNVLSHNGGAIVAAGGLNNASGLVGAGGLNNQSRLVGQDAASLVGQDAASLVGADGASLVAAGAGNLVGTDGASLVGTDGGSLVAAGAGN